MAIAVAIELEILTASGDGEALQPASIEVRRGRDFGIVDDLALFVVEFRQGTTPQRPDANDIDRHVAFLRLLDRGRDLAAPRLTVGDEHEQLGVRVLAVNFLIALDDTQAPVDAELEVRIPGGRVIDAERWF